MWMMTVPNFYRIETSRYDLSDYNKLIEEPLDNRRGRIRSMASPRSARHEPQLLETQRPRWLRRPQCVRVIPL